MNFTTSIEKKKYMNITEIAEYFGINYFHAYKLLNTDETMPYLKFGRKKLWLSSDIENFLQKHLVVPSKKED